MLRHLARWRLSAGILGVSAMVLWPVPVFQILHVESSAVIAAMAWLCTGLAAVGCRSGLRHLGILIGAHIAYLAIPLLALTVSMIWAPNCAYVTGLAFFAAFTVPSVVMGGAVGYACRNAFESGRRVAFVIVTLFITSAGVVYDLGFHPQFYTYSHVFGGVVGPLYDEDITFRPALLWFRLLTGLWATVFVIIGLRSRLKRMRPTDVVLRLRSRLASLVVVLALPIGVIYLTAAWLGINSPAWFIEHELGGRTTSSNFVFFHDRSLTQAERSEMVGMYEYHFARLGGILETQPKSPISVYIYPDAFARERLTGARYTNVAPVWLPKPQIHVLADVPERIHAHELVHVFSREFGLPVINASLAVGLVEGLAVALEGPSGGPSPHDQVAAMLDDPQFDVADVASRLSPTGFWGGRGAVSYTVSGSFVSFLLDHYGPERLKNLYPTGRFRAHYGRTGRALADEWEAYLRSRPVISSAAARTAVQRFSVPSLFEVRCPHYVPLHRRHYVDAQRALADGDTGRAVVSLDASISSEPSFAQAVFLRADMHLRESQTRSARSILDALQESPGRDVRLGDIAAIEGLAAAAMRAYEVVAAQVPHTERQFRAMLALRKEVASNPELVTALYAEPGPDAPETRSSAEAIVLASAYIGHLRATEALTLLDLDIDLHPLDETAWLIERLRMRLTIRAAYLAGQPGVVVETSERGRQLALERGDVDLANYLEHHHRRGEWFRTNRH